MDAGAGRARPEQQQPQHGRDPPQRSRRAAGRHVYSSISILFPRRFRGQGGGHVTGRGRPTLPPPLRSGFAGGGSGRPGAFVSLRGPSGLRRAALGLPGPSGRALRWAPASPLAQGGRCPRGTARALRGAAVVAVVREGPARGRSAAQPPQAAGALPAVAARLTGSPGAAESRSRRGR